MTAEKLREAARLMRERAESATPGRWEASDSGLTHPGAGMNVDSDSGASVVADCCGYQGGAGVDDAEHIASWHPAVADAVADLLDDAAENIRLRSPGMDVNQRLPFDMTVHIACEKALAVARAYLNEVPS